MYMIFKTFYFYFIEQKQRVIDDYINAAAGTKATILAADERMTEEEKKVEGEYNSDFFLNLVKLYIYKQQGNIIKNDIF